jgi:hypothetical protein
MCASTRDVKMSAGIDAMATASSDNDKPMQEPKKRAEGENVLETRLQVQLQAHLGRNLKAVYEALVQEPVPERFLKLLDKLERKEKKSS